jgi:hypothetical protein
MEITSVAPVENTQGFLSRGRLAWASIAAVGGCAALCSLPMLAPLLGGGAIGVLAALVSPSVELAAGAVIFVTVAGVLGLRAKRTRARRSPGPAKSLTTGVSNIPIACDPLVFSKEQRAEHHQLATNVIVRWPSQRVELADGFEFHYQGTEERFLEIARWVASEHRCCAWASFALEMDPFTSDDPGAIRLRMRGGLEGKAMLKDAFSLLEGDPRAEMFLNPTGTITAEAFAKAKSSTGRGCGC